MPNCARVNTSFERKPEIMNNLTLAEQAKVQAMQGTPPTPNDAVVAATNAATAATTKAADEAADKEAKARAAKDRKNAAARAKRAAKAQAAPMLLVPAAPKPKAEVKPKAPAKPKAAPSALGGAREGAGRKPVYSEAMDKAVSIKLTARQHKAFMAIEGGGPAWVRWGLDQLMTAKKGK